MLICWYNSVLHKWLWNLFYTKNEVIEFWKFQFWKRKKSYDRTAHKVRSFFFPFGENVKGPNPVCSNICFVTYKLATNLLLTNSGFVIRARNPITNPEFVASLYASAPKKTQQGMHISLKSVFQECSVQTVFRIMLHNSVWEVMTFRPSCNFSVRYYYFVQNWNFQNSMTSFLV